MTSFAIRSLDSGDCVQTTCPQGATRLGTALSQSIASKEEYRERKMARLAFLTNSMYISELATLTRFPVAKKNCAGAHA